MGARNWDDPESHCMSAKEKLLWWAVILAPAMAVPAWLFATSPFSPQDTVVHQLSALGCPVAGFFGVAPAKAGAPGYHASLDANGDGIACETERTARPRHQTDAKFVRPEKS